VIGASTTGEGAFACADPRLPDSNPNRQNGLYRVDSWDSKAHAVTGAVHSAGGAQAVADPRPGLQRGRGSDYLTAGHYGVVPWSKPAYAVTGTARHDNGHGNVADPRLPSPDERLRCLIVAEDGTWHRPFTTMENAALQSIFDPEEYMHFTLFGGSDQLYREWIGNAAPRDAMTAIAEVIGQALLLAWSGETQIVGDGPIWVQPIIAAIQCGETNLAAGAA
jgi:site-specific DNA-cytosine methylase